MNTYSMPKISPKWKDKTTNSKQIPATIRAVSYMKFGPSKIYRMAVSSAVTIAHTSGDEERGDELDGEV